MSGRVAPGSAQAAGAIVGEGRARRLILPSLASVPGLLHAFSLRGSDAASILSAESGRDMPFAALRQVHSAAVRVVGADGPEPGARSRPASDAPPEGDALVTRRSGLALVVYVADCAPVLICDERTHALAAVHAGWRGTVAGVLKRAITALGESCGARPIDLRVGIGPCIGGCCFEVGDEVIDALLRADPGAVGCVLDGPRRRIDLVEANRRQALECGVVPDRIEAAGLCTMCRADLCESYRRARGRAGRMAALIAWRP